jgi:hypothetical protein
MKRLVKGSSGVVCRAACLALRLMLVRVARSMTRADSLRVLQRAIGAYRCIVAQTALLSKSVHGGATAARRLRLTGHT